MLPPISQCDHNVVAVKCNFTMLIPPVYKRRMWHFKDADFNAYRTYLTNNEWNCLSMRDIENITRSFTSDLYNIAIKSIPNKLVSLRCNDKPWFNSNLRRMKRRCMRLYKIYKKKKDIRSHDAYKEYNSQYRDEIKLCKKVYNDSRVASLAKDAFLKPRKWWKLLKNINKENETFESIPSLHIADKIITNDKEKSDEFNSFFLSMSHIDTAGKTVPDIDRIINDNSLSSLEVTEQDVIDQLLTLDVNKAFGPDEISPKFLKEGAVELAPILMFIYNESLTKGIFPQDWKRANVIPLFKKGNRHEINNYRPVSLLSVLGKVFERIVFKKYI